MQIIDHPAKIVGTSVARRRCEITGHLIAPRSGKRMLHHGHQLDVGKTEIVEVIRDRRMWTRPSHSLKSPTTLTPAAFGAHTAKLTPRTPLFTRACAPSCSWMRSCLPSFHRC